MANSVYDDQDTDRKDDYIRDAEANPAESKGTVNGAGANSGGNKYDDIRNDSNTKQPGSGKSADAKALKSDEEEASPDRSGFSARDDIREKIGLGYTGKGSEKSKTLSRLYSRNSNFKKKVAIIGAAVGGGGLFGGLIFLALLPLRIDSFLQNIDQSFGAPASQAISTESDKFLSNWLKKEVIPALNTGTCKSTVSPKCVLVDSKTTGPPGKLYAAWRKNRLDQKLATDYGIIIGKDSSGYAVMNLHGDAISLKELQNGNKSLFELAGTNRVSSADIRAEINRGLEGESKWKASYKRYLITKNIDKHLGTYAHCLLACDTREKIKISTTTGKLGAKLWFIQRFIAPRLQSTSVLLTCMQDPQSCKGGRGANAKIAQATEAYMNTPGNTEGDLNKLVAKAEGINKLGFVGYTEKMAVQGLATAVLGDTSGVAVGEAAEKAIPIIGWVSLGVTIAALASELPSILHDVSYATNSQAAAQLYTTYQVADSEMHSGNTDGAAYGSLWNALSANSDLGTTHSDATSTPAYQQLMAANGSGTDAFTSPGSIFGAVESDKADPYLCNDGKPVPAGQLACAEEDFSKTNSSSLDALSKSSALQATSKVLAPAATILNAPTAVISKAIEPFCKVPGLSNACNAAGSAAQSVVGSAVDQVIPDPFSDMSGGRTGDMVIAGGDVTNNTASQQLIGAKKVTPVQITSIRNQEIADAKQAFQSQPLFARMFNTTTPYSFVSRLAMVMPPSFTGLQNTLSSVLMNPFHVITTVFSSLLTSNRAFAATTPRSDPWGISQYAYTAADYAAIGNDPGDFFAKNCAITNSKYGTYDADTEIFDGTSWLNNEDVQNFDASGQPTNTQVNPCLLIQATIQSTGVLYDTSLIPAGSQTADLAAAAAL